MYNGIASFVERLEKEGELIRIKTAVSTDLEIAEITDRMCKSKDGGKALLFENNGTPFPVITNMMGSLKRINIALGTKELNEIPQRIDNIFNSVKRPKHSFTDKLKMLPLASEVASFMPKRKRKYGESQQMIMLGENVDIDILPILKCAPYDGGKFITLPLVHTIDPENGVTNVGMYRAQVIDSQSVALHWHKHKTGERHYNEYKRRGEKMPVTICLGGDPVYTYCATAPLPDGIDEYIFGGFLRHKSVELVQCLTNEIYVPSDCDIVIEGYVDPTENKFYEGPFGDHTGFYSLEDWYPIMHITAISHRRDAIFPATLVGIPPQEDVYFAKATERIFLSPIKNVMLREVKDMWLPQEGVAHNLAIVDIYKEYIGHPQKVAAALWGAGQMMFNKFIVITALNDDENIEDIDVIKRCLKNVNIPDDILISKGPLDILDHTANIMGYGGKMLIDATGETTSYAFQIDNSNNFDIDVKLAEQEWPILICYTDSNVSLKDYSSKIISELSPKGIKFIALLNSAVKELSYRDKLWILCGNCDASRDTNIDSNILFLDGRAKDGGINGFNREWPNVVVMDKDMIAKVDSRWEEYNIGSFIPSPSEKYSILKITEGASTTKK